MNSKKHHLELLRKRYRLPISLLMHEIPLGSPLRGAGFEIGPSADAWGKLKITGLVTCFEDAQELTNLCTVRGVYKLCIRYADYVSMWCVDSVKSHMRSVCDGGGDATAALKVVVLNPHVPKEKVRLRGKLDTLSSKFSDVVCLANKGNTAQQWQRFKDLRFEFGVALENASKNATSADLMKTTHLDWLLALELSYDAPSVARQEGLWLLKHFFPEEHAYVHLDGHIVAAQLEEVRKRIQERVSDREDIPSAFNLHQARQLVLGAVGRLHLESNLLAAIEKVCNVMDQYCNKEVTEVKLSEIITSQVYVLRNMTCKRSLIGCLFINLNDEIEEDSENDNENEEEDSSHEGSVRGDSDDKFAVYEEEDILAEDNAGNAFQFDDEEMSDSSESSVNSSIKEEPEPNEETPVSATSFVSSYSEMGDADFSLFLDLEFRDEECNNDEFADYDHPSDKTCMNEVIEKQNTLSENLGTAEQVLLDLNALKVIKKLTEHFPIKRAPLRVRFTAPKPNFPGLMEKIGEWNAIVISKDELSTQPSIVCEIEPSLLHSCEERLKDVQGRVEVLSVSAHAESGPSVEQHDSIEVPQAAPVKELDAVAQISETMQKQSISTESQGNAQGKQQRRCKECDVLVEDKLYREHCKSGWHKHNYTRHKNGLPPLSQEECLVEMELADSRKDLKDYDF